MDEEHHGYAAWASGRCLELKVVRVWLLFCYPFPSQGPRLSPPTNSAPVGKKRSPVMKVSFLGVYSLFQIRDLPILIFHPCVCPGRTARRTPVAPNLGVAWKANNLQRAGVLTLARRM